MFWYFVFLVFLLLICFCFLYFLFSCSLVSILYSVCFFIFICIHPLCSLTCHVFVCCCFCFVLFRSGLHAKQLSPWSLLIGITDNGCVWNVEFVAAHFLHSPIVCDILISREPMGMLSDDIMSVILHSHWLIFCNAWWDWFLFLPHAFLM